MKKKPKKKAKPRVLTITPEDLAEYRDLQRRDYLRDILDGAGAGTTTTQMLWWALWLVLGVTAGVGAVILVHLHR